MSVSANLHVTRRSELTSMIKSFSRALVAWRGVSSAGVSRVLCVANTLITLADHAKFVPQPEPAPGAMAAIHEEASIAFNWIRENVKRLERICKGLCEQLERMIMGDFSADHDAGEPILATLTAKAWIDMLKSAVGCLQSDLEDKNKIIDSVEQIVLGLAPVDGATLERGAEIWLEMPRIHEVLVDIVAPAYDAEYAAFQLLSADVHSTALHQSPSNMPIPDSRLHASGKPVGGEYSPAVSFLLGKQPENSQ